MCEKVSFSFSLCCHSGKVQSSCLIEQTNFVHDVLFCRKNLIISVRIIETIENGKGHSFTDLKLRIMLWADSWVWSDKVIMWMESISSLTFQMKAIEYYFPEVLFIMLYNCGTNVWVCGWNPKVWPLKWKLLSSSFLWCFLLCCTKWS